MKTDVNLPVILTVTEPQYFEYLKEQLSNIIPKIQFEELEFANGVHQAIFFTRKDKNYRALMGIEVEDTTTEDTETQEVLQAG